LSPSGAPGLTVWSRLRHGLRAWLCTLLTLTGLAGGSAALAQTGTPAFPTHPVKIILPSPPGGVTDLLGRMLGQRLAQVWGQPVIIENKPGAGKIIAAEQLMKSPADGHTLLITEAATLVVNPHLYRNLPYDPLRDFTPVTLIAENYPVLVVNAALPVRNARELVAHARSHPGALSYGTMGVGTYAHIALENFRQINGISLVHVPYKGAAPAMADLVAGEIAMMVVNLNVADPFVKQGKLRVIGATTPGRIASRPEFPTIREQGVPGLEVTSWFGVIGPPRIPEALTERLAAEINRVVRSPEFLEQVLSRNGLEPLTSNPTAFRQLIRDELVTWGRMVKVSGATAD
jgi:tripartite-type tricarboxylate transporter receptor subunit TctC